MLALTWPCVLLTSLWWCTMLVLVQGPVALQELLLVMLLVLVLVLLLMLLAWLGQ